MLHHSRYMAGRILPNFSILRLEIAKSGTEQMCGLMSSIILRSFNLDGLVICEKIDKNKVVNVRTDIAEPLYNVITNDLIMRSNK